MGEFDVIGTKDLVAIDGPQDGVLRARNRLTTLRLGRIYSAIGKVHWEATEAESSVRKAQVGYRAPDPSTGRAKEHDGIRLGAYQERTERAERVLAALEGILGGLGNDLDISLAGLEALAAL